MKLLLDTHAMIWWIGQRGKVSETIRVLIHASSTEVYVSAASAWELAIKAQARRIRVSHKLLDNFGDEIETLGWSSLPILAHHGIAAARLAGPHRDPFDRMLVAQAMIEQMSIASVDPELTRLGATVVW